MPPSRRQVSAALPFAARDIAGWPAIAQSGRKPVTFWFAQANPDGQRALRRDLVEAFNASRDKYQLQLEVKGAAVNNLLKVALVASTAIANAGQVLPLDGFAETFEGKDRFLPGLLNTAEQEAA
jgi:raffinose/stachyose/melibiose transport system substrate-binding protein